MASIRKQKREQQARVEIVRSFTYKLNVGNYESRDFFCSQKSECAASDSIEVSAALYQFCKSEVLRAVGEYRRELKEQRAKQMEGAT